MDREGLQSTVSSRHGPPPGRGRVGSSILDESDRPPGWKIAGIWHGATVSAGELAPDRHNDQIIASGFTGPSAPWGSPKRQKARQPATSSPASRPVLPSL